MKEETNITAQTKQPEDKSNSGRVVSYVPFYEDENITLYNADMLNVIDSLPPIDCVITDPPYGTQTNQRGESFMIGEFSNVLPLALPQIYNKMKSDGAFYCFTSWTMMAEWLMRFQQYFKLQNIIIWDKQRHSGCYSPSSWQFTWEGIFYGIKGKRKIYKYQRDVLQSKEKGKRVAMQKPVDIIEQMILASTKEDDLILDPFAGSGSTLVAAKNLGRKAVGIEINPDFCKMIVNRLSQTAMPFN